MFNIESRVWYMYTYRIKPDSEYIIHKVSNFEIFGNDHIGSPGCLIPAFFGESMRKI